MAEPIFQKKQHPGKQTQRVRQRKEALQDNRKTSLVEGAASKEARPDDVMQLMRDGAAIRGTASGQVHPDFNHTNFAFSTVEQGRTPSHYFHSSQGLGIMRMRTQHGDGPALTTPTSQGQYFFPSREAMDHWVAYVENGGDPRAYPGYRDPQSGALIYPANTPTQGHFHAEVRESGRVHHSGGLVDTAHPAQNDHDLNDMARAITDNRATYRSNAAVDVAQLSTKGPGAVAGNKRRVK
jgi:hypothetical protein